MDIVLRELNRNDVEQARQWRNGSPETLRTPYPLTVEMQQKFYDEVVCARGATDRFWAIAWDCGDLLPDEPCYHTIGMGGFTGIQWENRIAEISLILAPGHRGIGKGERAVELLLQQAFNQMGLQTVFGECYMCNPAVEFWKKIADKYHGFQVGLPARKYWDNNYWGALYFSIDKDEFNRTNSIIQSA